MMVRRPRSHGTIVHSPRISQRQRPRLIPLRRAVDIARRLRDSDPVAVDARLVGLARSASLLKSVIGVLADGEDGREADGPARGGEEGVSRRHDPEDDDQPEECELGDFGKEDEVDGF